MDSLNADIWTNVARKNTKIHKGFVLRNSKFLSSKNIQMEKIIPYYTAYHN